MGKTIGIDFGTANSCMAAVVDGRPVVLANAEGERLTPSVVALAGDGSRIGLLGALSAAADPTSAVVSVKRFLGRKEAEVTAERQLVPYAVVAGPGGDARIDAGGRQYGPPELAAMVLAKLKADAEAVLGEPIDGAVVTVPACFDDVQRYATKEAGKIAGLDIRRFINEPSAVSLACGVADGRDRTLAVCRFGAGSFDVSVVEIGDGVFEVKATAGDGHLGGDDFDRAVVDRLAAELEIDLGYDAVVRALLWEAARKARTELTRATEAEVVLPLLLPGPHGAARVSRVLTRAQLEHLVAPLLERVVGPVKQALADAKEVGVAAVDEVVLVGGVAAMPAVQLKVRALVGLTPLAPPGSEHAAALGAAIQAGVMTGDVKDALLLDVTPLALGIETKGGVMTNLIERNTTIPTRDVEIFSTADDNQPSIEIHLLQGEHEMARHNKSLGKFHVTGIVPAPRGVPKIEVAFDIDANGILSVSATDLHTGRAQTLRHEPASGPPAEPEPESPQAAAQAEGGDVDWEVVDESPAALATPTPTAEGGRSIAGDGTPGPGVELFYSYSHQDERLRSQLETHLSLLRRQGVVDEWHDRLIDPGDEWKEAIDAHMHRAKLILLLVSPDFMASDYCYDREMTIALERHARGEAVVVPVILRPVDWMSSPLGQLQALPKDAKPVIQWGRRDSAWLDVSSGLRRIATELLRQEKRGRPSA